MIIIFTTCTNEIKKRISNYKEINNFKEARVVALVAVSILDVSSI